MSGEQRQYAGRQVHDHGRGVAGVVVEESNLSVQIAAIRWILGQQPGDARWVETIPFLQDHWLVFMARMGFRPQLSCHY